MSSCRTWAVVRAFAAFAGVAACTAEAGRSTPDTLVAATPASTRASVPPGVTDPTSTVGLPDAEDRWTEDMQVLAEGVRRIHPNPFWRQSEAAFDASLAAAPAVLAGLGDSDARAEVMRLTAQIDGHTGVYLADVGFHLYDIHLYEFGGEFAVIAAADTALVGATVLSIDGVPVADAAAAVTPYSPFDNAATIELVVPTLLTTPEVLHAAGVIDDTDAPGYVVRLNDGTEQTIDPDQRSWDEFLAVDPRPIGMTKNPSTPTLARIDEAFWTATFDSAPGADPTLYVQYNEVVQASGSTSITELADEIDATLDERGTGRVVVDLRYNPGGNDRTYGPLLRVLTTHPTLERPGSLVVLIGRQTFSAAVLFATELDEQTNAVFVGEPTGGSPNLYANPRTLTLPNSGIVVNVSSQYFEGGGPSDRRDAITPDVAITTGVDDLLVGRDPVLDAALALAVD